MINHENYTYEVDQWIQQLITEQKTRKDKKQFIGDRPYRHIDSRISLQSLYTNEAEKVKKVLSSPLKLSKHSFYPFLRKDRKFRKFSKIDIKGANKPLISQKIRPIMYASHFDSCIYGFYSYLLKKYLEEELVNKGISKNIIAYRRIPRNDKSGRNKSNIDFVNDIYQEVRSLNKAAVVCLDIKGFFDNIDHFKLKQKWASLLNSSELPQGHQVVYKNITNFRYMFLFQAMETLGMGKVIKGKFHYNDGAKTTGSLTKSSKEYNRLLNNDSHIHKNRKPRGIPQGSPISDVLANIYLLDFDYEIVNWLKNNDGGTYKRYSDDILVVCKFEKIEELYSHIKTMLHGEKLEINPKKTEMFYVNTESKELADKTSILEKGYKRNKKSIQYLGFEFDLMDINVRSGTIAKHYRRYLKKIKHSRKKDKKTDEKPKKAKVINKRVDRFAYLKQSVKRISNSSRLPKQISVVKKRERKIKRSIDD